MFISVYASGTNIQRLAKCSKKIDGVLYSAYSQLEKNEPGIVKRKFFCTEASTIKAEVEKLGAEVMPSWLKIWGRPLANEMFIEELFGALLGVNPLRPELNLAAMTGGQVYCFMMLVSANKKEMGQIAKIAARKYPDYYFKVLNGDFTSNKKAEEETVGEINKAKVEKKKGVVIIANQMGSRSYSIPEIQATVISFDRGSVDATQQKVSRCLTPGNDYNGDKKEYGAIVDLSFDPNRAENIERIILEEAIQVQRSGDVTDFAAAVKFILSSVDVFKMNGYGYPVAITEEEMFSVFGDNDAMLKVADVSVDIAGAIDSGLFDIIASITAGAKGAKAKKDIVGAGVKNAVTEGGAEGQEGKNMSDPELRQMAKIMNDRIRALNMSATSVYHLANLQGESYRECLTIIAANKESNAEFIELFGISANSVIANLLDNNVLNEAILDVIVQNSKPKLVDFLF